ncbi:MAG: hypothetical protein AVDCRST_MAG38-2155, partial [uncultured Solirubrobacteraceae bacterium]
EVPAAGLGRSHHHARARARSRAARPFEADRPRCRGGGRRPGSQSLDPERRPVRGRLGVEPGRRAL